MARTALLTLWLLALSAPAALANDGGEGTWGETNDKIVTNAGFILIFGMPVLVLVLTLIQNALEKRKDRRLAAARARRARADIRGGW